MCLICMNWCQKDWNWKVKSRYFHATESPIVSKIKLLLLHWKSNVAAGNIDHWVSRQYMETSFCCIERRGNRDISLSPIPGWLSEETRKEQLGCGKKPVKNNELRYVFFVVRCRNFKTSFQFFSTFLRPFLELKKTLKILFNSFHSINC